MAEEQSDNRAAHLKPWQFKKGQSGNPGGRPKGSVSLKTRARNMLESMTDEEAQEFFEGLDKKTIWEMAEGKAEAKTEMTIEAPKPLINLNVQRDNSNTEDNSAG